jgi:hypothetical protein
VYVSQSHIHVTSGLATSNNVMLWSRSRNLKAVNSIPQVLSDGLQRYAVRVGGGRGGKTKDRRPRYELPYACTKANHAQIARVWSQKSRPRAEMKR